MEAVGVRGEDEGVLYDGDSEGTEAVYPEEDFEGCCEGWGRVVAEVLLQTGDNCCDGEPEGWEEEAFTFVTEGIEGSAVEDEACCHERADEGEEDEVEEVDGETDLAVAFEFVRLVRDEEG